jgi:FKBP12-rapamycin complex-associated protein
LRKSAIETVGKLSSMVNLNDYAAKIIHPLVRILHSNEPSLRVAALDTLCALMLQLGRDYLHFEHTVGKAIAQHSIQHANYEKAVDKLKKGEVLSQNLAPRFEDNVTDLHAPESNPPKKLDLNPMHLKQAWETKGKSTKDDWHEWFRKFSTTLLTESPNHSLRACASLASNYQPLAKDLFNSAFVSCWSELYEQFQVSSTLEH